MDNTSVAPQLNTKQNATHFTVTVTTYAVDDGRYEQKAFMNCNSTVQQSFWELLECTNRRAWTSLCNLHEANNQVKLQAAAQMQQHCAALKSSWALMECTNRQA